MKEIIEILSPALGEELAKDIVSHRKGLKCPLTVRGARSLLKQYELSGNAVSAAEYQLNMGWRGFDVLWLKGKNFTDTNNPMATETIEERNKRLHLQDELRWARNEGNTNRQAQIQALLKRVGA